MIQMAVRSRAVHVIGGSCVERCLDSWIYPGVGAM